MTPESVDTWSLAVSVKAFFQLFIFPIKHTTYTVYTYVMTNKLYNTTTIQYNFNLKQAFPFISKFVYGVIFSGNIFFNV